MKNRTKIINEFYRIKELGFIKSTRPKNKDGGIGNTFEDLLGVQENNLNKADFEGFEIKSHRSLSGSYITLFTKSPSNPKGANRFLKDNFGRGDAKFPELKSLHTSMFGNKWNTVYDSFQMKLHVAKNEDKVFLLVRDNAENILSDNIYWTFTDLKKAINKISSLFVVFADSKKEDKISYFKYEKAVIYDDFSFDKFLSMLNNGNIMFDVRLGVYKSGKNMGKPHDHGSGFRIRKEKIKELYDTVIEL